MRKINKPSDIDVWDELLSNYTPPEKRVPNENELKQRFEFGNWSIDSFDDLLEINNYGIQRILRNMSSDQMTLALFDLSELIQKHFLKNCSLRTKEMLQEDLKNVNSTPTEIEQAQTELLRMAHEQLTELDQELWDKTMLLLPKEPLPEKPDVKFLLSLDQDSTKAWMDITPVDQQFHALIEASDWEILWEQKMKPLISEKALEIIEKDWYQMEPQFSWQMEIAQCLITYYAKQLYKQ